MVDPRFDPAFQRGYRARPSEGRGEAPVIPAPAPDLGSDAVVAVDPVVRPARNPFCLALLVASLLLLVAAGAIFWKAATASSQYDFGDPWQSFVQELLFTAPQALMTAGLLGVVGWIVLGAVHRGGR